MSLVDNRFSADEVSIANAGLGTAQILIQAYADTIEVQPDVVLTAVPGLPIDQGTARDASGYCLKTIVPALNTAVSLALGYNNQFASMSAKLLQQAKVLDGTTATPAERAAAAADMSAGLTLLTSTIDGTQPTRDGVVSVLATAAGLVEQASLSLDTDLAVAKANLQQDEIPKLQAQVAAVLQAMNNDNKLIASGGVYGVVAGLKVAVGIVTAYYGDKGKGVQMALGAIQGAVTESEKHQAAMADLHVQAAAYMDLLPKLLDAQLTFAIILTLSQNADLLTAHIQAAQAATTALQAAWAGAKTGLQNLQTQLAGGKTNALNLTAQLTQAIPVWAAAGDTASRLQTIGLLPVNQAPVT